MRFEIVSRECCKWLLILSSIIRGILNNKSRAITYVLLLYIYIYDVDFFLIKIHLWKGLNEFIYSRTDS